MIVKGTPDFLERLIFLIENPVCQDLCRFFAQLGWDIDVSHNPRRAIAHKLGSGIEIDLWQMTSWIDESRTMRNRK